MQISRGKYDRLPRTPAESTALALMDAGLRRYGPARPTRDASYSVSVRQVAVLLPRFFQTAPRGRRPCASLALRLHQTLGRGLAPPSCRTCSAHPPLWTHRTRPQGFGNLAQNARFPQRPHRSSGSLKKKKKKKEERTKNRPVRSTVHRIGSLPRTRRARVTRRCGRAPRLERRCRAHSASTAEMNEIAGPKKLARHGPIDTRNCAGWFCFDKPATPLARSVLRRICRGRLPKM